MGGVDIEIAAGEFFTLLGPSGSGKTTTLRLIAGFEEPDAGRVELGGRDVTGLPPYDRDVNTVFQDYALFPHMTVGENVEYGMRVKRADKAERASRRDEALEMVRLAGYEERKPSELSGGQRQRVALARAIVNRPAGPAARRAPRRPRSEAARANAGGAEGDPGPGWDHLHLRDPRPGRGADDERSRRSLQRRAHRAGRGVRRRSTSARRPASSAGSSASRTSWSATAAASRSVPRNCASSRRVTRATASSPSRGKVADVAYAGMVTRYLIALDRGGELLVVRQNLETSSEQALAERGREVKVGWRPEHAVAVPDERERESSA